MGSSKCFRHVVGDKVGPEVGTKVGYTVGDLVGIGVGEEQPLQVKAQLSKKLAHTPCVFIA